MAHVHLGTALEQSQLGEGQIADRIALGIEKLMAFASRFSTPSESA